MTIDEAKASLQALCHTCKHFPTCVNDKPECFQAIEMAIKSLEADRTIEKTLYAIREEMQFIKVAEFQIYGKSSWRFSNAIEDIIDRHLSEVSE